jgi:hypothetical protein
MLQFKIVDLLELSLIAGRKKLSYVALFTIMAQAVLFS